MAATATLYFHVFSEKHLFRTNKKIVSKVCTNDEQQVSSRNLQTRDILTLTSDWKVPNRKVVSDSSDRGKPN